MSPPRSWYWGVRCDYFIQRHLRSHEHNRVRLHVLFVAFCYRVVVVMADIVGQINLYVAGLEDRQTEAVALLEAAAQEITRLSMYNDTNPKIRVYPHQLPASDKNKPFRADIIGVNYDHHAVAATPAEALFDAAARWHVLSKKGG